MPDFDPRDFTSHDRDARRPDLSRGGQSDPAARGTDRATRDPRDAAVRHADLPSGPRREPFRVRGRGYNLNGDQGRVLATVGAFRVVSSHDLETSFGRVGDQGSSALRVLPQCPARARQHRGSTGSRQKLENRTQGKWRALGEPPLLALVEMRGIVPAM